MGGSGTSTTPTRLAGVQVSTSAQGLVVAKGWGTGRFKTNMLWYGNFQSKATKSSGGGGKGGGSQTTGYTYSAAVILGMCAGPIAAVPTVYVDKTVYLGPTAAGLSLANGAVGQAVWGWLTTNAPSQAIGYSGIAYLYAPSYSLGSSGSTPNISMEVQSNHTFGSLPDCLPDVILTDFLTNPKDGVPGWPSGVLASLTNFSQYCQAANFLLSPVIDTQVTAASFIDDLMTCTNSYIFWSEGMAKVTPRGDAVITGNGMTWTPNLTPVYSLTDDSYIETSAGEPPVFLDLSDQTDAYNIVQVEFLDRTNQYNVALAPRQDDSNIAQYGPRKQDPKTLHMICDPVVANNVAQVYLQDILYIRGEYNFTLPWNYALLEPTDLLAINDSGMGLVNFLVRIIEIDDDEYGCRGIIAEEVPVGVASPPIYSHQDSSSYIPNQGVAASPVATPYIFNPPSTLTSSGQETWIAVAGSVPATWGGCNVWTSLDNANYQMVGVIDGPCRYGVLSSALASAADPDTTNTLAVDLTTSSGAMLNATAADENGLVTLCLVDGELVSYQNATLTSAYHYSLSSMRRGAMGTTPAAHASGAPFVRLDGAPFVVPFNANNVGQTVYVKLQSFNPVGGGVQALSACTAYTIVPGKVIAGGSVTGKNAGGSDIGADVTANSAQATYIDATGRVFDGRGLPINASQGSSYVLNPPYPLSSAATTTITVAASVLSVSGTSYSLPSGSITGLVAGTVYVVFYDLVFASYTAIASGTSSYYTSAARFIWVGIQSTQTSGGGYTAPPSPPSGGGGGRYAQP